MKTDLPFISKLASLFFVIIIFVVFRLPAIAQGNTDAEQDKLLPPAAEKFAEADAVASPWRVGDCPDVFYKMADCHKVGGSEYSETSHTSIYNEDGSLWYIYGNQHINPDFYKKNKTMDFLPFANFGDFGNNTILRMVGESKHWYQVVVNEKTQATKFILKSDPRWEKTTWQFWLAKIAHFFVDENDRTEVYDKPNGNVIGSAANSKISHFRYLGKMDGDWAFVQVSINGQFCYPVESKSKQCYPGWIRWREGRKFLVNTSLNAFTITEIKPDAKD